MILTILATSDSTRPVAIHGTAALIMRATASMLRVPQLPLPFLRLRTYTATEIQHRKDVFPSSSTTGIPETASRRQSISQEDILRCLHTYMVSRLA